MISYPTFYLLVALTAYSNAAPPVVIEKFVAAIHCEATAQALRNTQKNRERTTYDFFCVPAALTRPENVK